MSWPHVWCGLFNVRCGTLPPDIAEQMHLQYAAALSNTCKCMQLHALPADGLDALVSGMVRNWSWVIWMILAGALLGNWSFEKGHTMLCHHEKDDLVGRHALLAVNCSVPSVLVPVL